MWRRGEERFGCRAGAGGGLTVLVGHLASKAGLRDAPDLLNVNPIEPRQRVAVVHDLHVWRLRLHSHRLHRGLCSLRSLSLSLSSRLVSSRLVSDLRLAGKSKLALLAGKSKATQMILNSENRYEQPNSTLKFEVEHQGPERRWRRNQDRASGRRDLGAAQGRGRGPRGVQDRTGGRPGWSAVRGRIKN